MKLSSTMFFSALFLLVSDDWHWQSTSSKIRNKNNIGIYFCNALSTSSSSSSVSTYPTSALTSVGKSQLAVLDGAEWNSVQSILREEKSLLSQSSPSSSSSITATKYGYMKVVTGRDAENRRVVAMQCMNNKDQQTLVYEESVAVIPDKVSEEDAIATYIASLSAVHCALPKLDNVGGGKDSIVMGKAVVLGNSDIACFAAEGLASLGIEVFLVNNKGYANVKQNVGKIQVIKPAVGSSGTGFSSHLGKFDSIVDTIGNERSPSLSLEDPISDDDYDMGMSFGGSVLQLLKTRHNCRKYVSTLTHCQNLVANEGIFGGPGKAEEYSQKVGNASFLEKSRDCQSIPPPKSIGNTLETLMGKGVIYTDQQRQKTCSKKSNAIRGWSLSDFWEQTSWPRDSSGTGTVRFGLPVRDDPDEDDDGDGFYMISEAPYRKQEKRWVESADEEYGETGESSPNPENRAIQDNPYVLNVLGVDGLESEIVGKEMDCIMFMSAKFCKTCRSINPIYTRMARLNQENESSSLSFVKAEASGAMGKQLGRHLSVQAVPSFVLFRKGKRFGVPLSVSKLPSPKIDRALELLSSGSDWNDSILDEDE